MSSDTDLDFAGMSLICNTIKYGASASGQTGTTLTAAELGYVDGITPGTAAASKAVILDSSKGIATITSATITTLTAPTIAGATEFTGAVTCDTTLAVTGVATFSANPTFAAGKTLDLDSTTATLVSNAASITKFACQVTTESLTTASGASQAFAITGTSLFAATDLAFVTPAGGTNTRKNYIYETVMTSNTCTVTVTNNHASALNGTLIFNLWIVKA